MQLKYCDICPEVEKKKENKRKQVTFSNYPPLNTIVHNLVQFSQL